MTEVYYAGRQWYVTSNGLETLKPYRYDIEASTLGHLTDGAEQPIAERMRHVGMKTWIDLEDFAAAFAVALQIHAGKYPALPEGAFHNALVRLRASKARSEVYREMYPPKPGGLDAFEGAEQLMASDEEFGRRYPDHDVFRTVDIDWPADDD